MILDVRRITVSWPRVIALALATASLTLVISFPTSAAACSTCHSCQSLEHADKHEHGQHSHATTSRSQSAAESRRNTGPPRSASSSAFRFGVVGDTQGLQYVEQLITDMNAHEPSLVVFPGDLVSTGSPSSWRQWDQSTQHFVGGPANRLMVPGNHDLPVGGDAQWKQTFDWLPASQTVGGMKGIDRMDYFVDFANTRFISVTTDSQANGAGGPPAAQLWLENVLSDAETQAKDHVFVYSHHPVTFNNYDRTEGTAGPWWQAIGTAGNVTGLFVGHWHQYQPSQPHPHHHTWEVIAGTGNSGFSGHPWQNKVGYSMVEVDGPRVTLSFYGDRDNDGSYDDLLDSFVMADSSTPDADVVAYYGFEDSQSNLDTALSAWSKANTGDYLGDAAAVASGAAGRALSLDGSGDHATGRGIGDYNMALLNDLTISIQANFDALRDGTSANTLVSYSADVAGYTDREEAVNQPYNLRIRRDRRLEFFWEHDNNVKETFVSTAAAGVSAGEWHEYRVTRDTVSGEIRFYVDGTLLGDPLVFDPADELPTGGAQGILRVGINYNRDHPNKLVGAFDGLLDELTLWNEVTMDDYAGPLPGDVNLDGVLSGDGSGPAASDDVRAFIDGWMTARPEDDMVTRWKKGDLDLNGRNDLFDLVAFQRALSDAGLAFPGLPEPTAISMLLSALAGLAMCRRFQAK